MPQVIVAALARHHVANRQHAQPAALEAPGALIEPPHRLMASAAPVAIPVLVGRVMLRALVEPRHEAASAIGIAC